MIIRRLPNMSPSRPKSPAVTAPETQNEVISVVVSLGEAPKEASMSGSDGINIVCETA